jgi:hypothetical protein
MKKRRVEAAMLVVEARSRNGGSGGSSGGSGGGSGGSGGSGGAVGAHLKPPAARRAAAGRRACSDLSVVGAHGGVRAWGHNEDYSKVFAATNYLVRIVGMRCEEKGARFRFSCIRSCVAGSGNNACRGVRFDMAAQ